MTDAITAENKHNDEQNVNMEGRLGTIVRSMQRPEAGVLIVDGPSYNIDLIIRRIKEVLPNLDIAQATSGPRDDTAYVTTMTIFEFFSQGEGSKSFMFKLLSDVAQRVRTCIRVESIDEETLTNIRFSSTGAIIINRANHQEMRYESFNYFKEEYPIADLPIDPEMEATLLSQVEGNAKRILNAEISRIAIIPSDLEDVLGGLKPIYIWTDGGTSTLSHIADHVFGMLPDNPTLQSRGPTHSEVFKFRDSSGKIVSEAGLYLTKKDPNRDNIFSHRLEMQPGQLSALSLMKRDGNFATFVTNHNGSGCIPLYHQNEDTHSHLENSLTFTVPMKDIGLAWETILKIRDSLAQNPLLDPWDDACTEDPNGDDGRWGSMTWKKMKALVTLAQDEGDACSDVEEVSEKIKCLADIYDNPSDTIKRKMEYWIGWFMTEVSYGHRVPEFEHWLNAHGSRDGMKTYIHYLGVPPRRGEQGTVYELRVR